jgi:hypothetical protein
MCNFSGRLIAWLDRELTEAEAINVEWHVRQCAECRRAVGSYQEISGAFLACYEAAMTAQPRRKALFWRWAGVSAGVAAAGAILLAILLAQPRAEKFSVNLPPRPHAPAFAYERPVFEKPSTPIAAAHAQVHVQHQAAPAPIRTQWIPEEPAVEVALPADALFPPGAVPAGFSFIADVHFQQ